MSEAALNGGDLGGGGGGGGGEGEEAAGPANFIDQPCPTQNGSQREVVIGELPENMEVLSRGNGWRGYCARWML